MCDVLARTRHVHDVQRWRKKPDGLIAFGPPHEIVSGDLSVRLGSEYFAEGEYKVVHALAVKQLEAQALTLAHLQTVMKLLQEGSDSESDSPDELEELEPEPDPETSSEPVEHQDRRDNVIVIKLVSGCSIMHALDARCGLALVAAHVDLDDVLCEDSIVF